MTKIQTAVIALAILASPLSYVAGQSVTTWLLAQRHVDCNAQALAWVEQFPANQTLATMPDFNCKR